ncbi:MAG: PH domain-containing protein [Chloroflexi bacterium]|nr:PH domain-containing protein [Chloroflexota bacterium]
MARHAADIIVDKDDQLERVEDFCLPQETIRAVFDLKGGDADFIAVLDRRVIFYGKAFTHTKKAMVTIPYRQIHAVSSADESGLLLKRGPFANSKLTLHASGDSFEFEFRGRERAYEAYTLIMEHLLEV